MLTSGYYQKHESDDDTPFCELNPRERQRRGNRHEKEWQKQKLQWEISKQEWGELDSHRKETQARDREYYGVGNGMNRGPPLSNGKYEWIVVGGRRRRFWSDSEDDYVERREPVDRLYRR